VWHFFYRIRVFAVKGKAGKLLGPANLFDTVRSRSVCADLRKTVHLSMSTARDSLQLSLLFSRLRS
jgi:hypothetical protein